MQLLKKIIRNILLGIIAGIVILVITMMLNGKYNFLGYNEARHFTTHFSHNTGYFKDSACEKITIKTLKTNLFNDSMYSLNYGDSCAMLVWIIKQSQDVSFSSSVDIGQEALQPGIQGVFYTYPNSRVKIGSGLFLHNFKNISVKFGNCTDIRNIIKNDRCQYYYLEAGSIYLTSDGNSNYDISLGLYKYLDVNFMVYTTNNKLYIFLLYSLYKTRIDPDELLRIINFPTK